MSPAVLTSRGQPCKWVSGEGTTRLSFYREFGFVDAQGLQTRRLRRHRSHLLQRSLPAEFAFNAHATPDGWELSEPDNCELLRGDLGWSIRTRHWGEFQLETSFQDNLVHQRDPQLLDKRRSPFVSSFFLFLGFLLLASLLGLWSGQETEESAAEVVEHVPDPVVIVTAQPKVVEIAPIPPPPQEKPRPTQKTLGFLKLLGSKQYQKQVGGLKSASETRSPGVGLGGSEGSGGEIIAGMGKGLYAATVGSTGTKGLGGLGTKGAGGGQGGYGELTGGSPGSALSKVALSESKTVDAGLDREQIQSTINRYLSQVRACYEEGLKRAPNLIGQVAVFFEVNGDGNLNFSRVQKSSLNDRDVEECIVRKMKFWKFPSPRNNVAVKIHYPFMLRPVR